MATAWNPEMAACLAETMRRINSIQFQPCPDCSCYECADCTCSLLHADRDRQLKAAEQLEAASLEILAMRNAGTANVERLSVERNAARKERNMLRSIVLEFLAAEEAWDAAWSGQDRARIRLATGRCSDAHAALVAYRNTSKVP